MARRLMSSLIKILPQYIANRIAAGEVVGRPEAVVKELIENSIDAGATQIQLIIRDAGKTLIQVIDNGTGMDEDDAILSFQRHATSKISAPEDLERIKTLGFRGEALASIYAVSQAELKTKTESSELGTLIKNHGSEITEHSKVQAEKGTSVAVRNLFYNTPAQRNFLKTNQTEFKHIYDTFIRLAIANPEIAFSFINEDEEIFELQGTALQKRLIQIYGDEITSNLIEVEYSNELISLTGFTSKPSFTKKSKQDQLLFLNKRYVISKALPYAVHMAYEDLVDKGDYPNFFLFISLDPEKFDVNVHPSKLEVNFEDEKAVFGFLRKGIRTTLDKNDLVVKVKIPVDDSTGGTKFNEQKSNILSSSTFTSRKEYNSGFTFKKHSSGDNVNIHEMFGKSALETKTGNDSSENELIESFEQDVLSGKLHKEENTDSLVSKNEIWQFQKKYIMYQLESTLVIHHQHAE